MAVNFVTSKCACGGKLEYDPNKKIWICMYCGTIVEREATFDRVKVDGIEGINDVVRQTLMDIAYKRMDSAQKNLADCERKNHKHIGTLLANLSLSMSMISLAKDKQESQSILDRVKFFAKRLQEEFPVIAVDEINLYESFGNDASDIYANLMIIYDTLKDSSRLEYISTKMNAGGIFSVDANKSLLKMSLKQGKLDVADSILQNTNNIDKKAALLDVIDNYPDGVNKRNALDNLLDKTVVEGITNTIFEKYFISSKDSVQTKNLLLGKTIEFKMKYNVEEVIKAIYSDLDGYEEAKATFSILCKSEMTDQEIDVLLRFCLMINKRTEIVFAYLDTLLDSGCFVKLNPRDMISFLDSSSYDAETTNEILERMFKFEIDNKSIDTVLNYYLCNNSDENEKRKIIIARLIYENVPISTTTIENYVLKANQDGVSKPEIIQSVFNTGFNKTYVGDILSKYIFTTIDENDVRESIIDYLLLNDFKVDGKVLNHYLANNKDSPIFIEKVMEKLVQYGTIIRSDSLDTYLLNLEHNSDFSTNIFKMLSKSSGMVSELAFSRYMLYCKDTCKVENAIKMIELVAIDLSRQSIAIENLGNELICNVFQAYLLDGCDDYDITHAITGMMHLKKIKLSNEILCNGNSIKFKKYVSENTRNLPEITIKLCEEYRLFSLW